MIHRLTLLNTILVMGLTAPAAHAVQDYGTWSGETTRTEHHVIPVNHAMPVHQVLVSAHVSADDTPGKPCTVVVRSYDERGRFTGPVLARVLAGAGNAENQEVRFANGLDQSGAIDPALRVTVVPGDAYSCHWTVSAYGDH